MTWLSVRRLILFIIAIPAIPIVWLMRRYIFEDRRNFLTDERAKWELVSMAVATMFLAFIYGVLIKVTL